MKANRALIALLANLLMAGCSLAAARPGPAIEPLQGQQPRLRVTAPPGIPRSRWPISAGVPFARGVLTDASQLTMADDAKHATAVQSRVLSRWPDGSVRWVLLDWQLEMQAKQERTVQVERGSTVAPPSAVKVSDHPDRIDVDTGPLQFAVPRARYAVLTDVRLDGKPIGTGPVVSFFNLDGQRLEAQAPVSVTISESGPLRVRLELRGHYTAEFDYVVRIDAFAGQSFVRIYHTFEQHSARPYVSVRELGLDVPITPKGAATYTAGLESGAPLSGRLPATGFVLFQEDNDILHAGAVRRTGRAGGWVDLHDGTHGVAVAARFFWQQYPQSFHLRSTGLTYNMWAPEAAAAKVGMGAAKTHEVVLYFHGATPPSAALLAALADPPAGRLDPQWVVATGALRNSVAPNAATASFLHALAAGYQRYQQHAAVERWDDSGQVTCPDPTHERPRTGFFGMLNWGDWNYPGYHDNTKGCDAWGNLEYDLTQVLALAYAATGERSYFEGMVAAARHFMDVDRVHYQHDHPNWMGMNHPKNPLHFAFELGGVDIGHTWTEGLLSYYYLTGDERGLEAARGIAHYLTWRLHAGILVGNPRQWGWPQIALIAAYEATGEDSYKTAAQGYARRGMAAWAPDQIAAWKMGILAEALAYTHSVSGDPAIRDWLARYATAVMARGSKSDGRYFPGIAYLGRITGNAAYTGAASAVVSRLQFGGWGKPFTIAGRLGFSILSLTGSAADGGKTK